MADLLQKRRSALPIPKEKRRMTMATFLLSSVKTCEGGHARSHHLLQKRRTALLVPRRRGW
jgi:hypothetical protein